jgi:hypothetical protein
MSWWATKDADRARHFSPSPAWQRSGARHQAGQ